MLVCSRTADEGRQWVDAINRVAQQLDANWRTLRKESTMRTPLRKQQLRQRHSDSLTWILNQRRNADKQLGQVNYHLSTQLSQSTLSHKDMKDFPETLTGLYE